ncbi:MAG: HpcH/HpaI aldolase family protein [Armatimonadota bacterium]
MFNRRALNLKKRLAGGGLASGLWVSLPCANSCEILADSGIDFVVVDSEHSPFNPETLQAMLMAFKGSDTVPMIRIPWNDHVYIKQALDMGWDGVLVPQCNTPEEAVAAVSACRYPPVGTRGFGPRRVGNYSRDEAEYIRLANDSVICAIQIEDVKGADCIDEIVKVPGVDWIFVGRWDMSGTTSEFGAIDSDEVMTAVRKVFGAAVKAGLPCGNAYQSVDRIGDTLNLGCNLVLLGEEAGLMRMAVDQAVKAFHQSAESHSNRKPR